MFSMMTGIKCYTVLLLNRLSDYKYEIIIDVILPD